MLSIDKVKKAHAEIILPIEKDKVKKQIKAEKNVEAKQIKEKEKTEKKEEVKGVKKETKPKVVKK